LAEIIKKINIKYIYYNIDPHEERWAAREASLDAPPQICKNIHFFQTTTGLQEYTFFQTTTQVG